MYRLDQFQQQLKSETWPSKATPDHATLSGYHILEHKFDNVD